MFIVNISAAVSYIVEMGSVFCLVFTVVLENVKRVIDGFFYGFANG